MRQLALIVAVWAAAAAMTTGAVVFATADTTVPLYTSATADVVRDGCLPPTDRDGVRAPGYWEHVQQPLDATDQPVVALTTHSLIPGDPADPNRPTSGPVLDAWIKPGDHNVASGTNGYRAECYSRYASTGSVPPASWPDPPGSTRRYDIAFRLDPQHFHLHESSSLWGPIVLQLKSHDGGSPVRSIELRADRWYSASSVAGRYDLSSAKADGTWQRFTITTTWSSDPTVGGVQIERNGKVLVPWRHLATTDTKGGKGDDPVYVKAGIYDTAADTTEQRVQVGPLTVTAVEPPA